MFGSSRKAARRDLATATQKLLEVNDRYITSLKALVEAQKREIVALQRLVELLKNKP